MRIIWMAIKRQKRKPGRETKIEIVQTSLETIEKTNPQLVLYKLWKKSFKDRLLSLEIARKSTRNADMLILLVFAWTRVQSGAVKCMSDCWNISVEKLPLSFYCGFKNKCQTDFISYFMAIERCNVVHNAHWLSRHNKKKEIFMITNTRIISWIHKINEWKHTQKSIFLVIEWKMSTFLL